MDTSSTKTNHNKASMAAYTYFVKLIRDEHRKKHPDEHFDFAEFSAKCAEKWKSMKPEERKRFEELAAEETDKKPPGRKKRTRKRQKKAPGQPKRAWSAFFYFCDDRRPKVRKDHPEWRVAEVARELGRLWEACSDRDKYEKMALLDKERYEKEMEQFRAGNFIAGETKRPKMSDNNPEDSEHEEEDEEEDEEGGSGVKKLEGQVAPEYDVNDVEKLVTQPQQPMAVTAPQIIAVASLPSVAVVGGGGEVTTIVDPSSLNNVTEAVTE